MRFRDDGQLDLGADKIEVAEFFYYMCPHCYNFEPLVKEWLKDKPANVRFVQIPAMWNQLLVLHDELRLAVGDRIQRAGFQPGDLGIGTIDAALRRNGYDGGGRVCL